MIRFGIGMYQSKNLSSILKKTRDSPAELLRNACQSYHSSVALKTIRADMDDIKDLLGNDKKVIHLVRDPRGVANSRKLMYISKETRTAFDQYLQGQIKTKPDDWPNLKFYTKSTEQSINSQHGQNQGNVNALCRRFRHDRQVDSNSHVYYAIVTKLLKYEGFEINPKKLLAKSFIGRSTPVSVRQWLALRWNPEWVEP